VIGAHRQHTIERREWLWVALWALVLLGTANAPVLLGWAIADAEMQFGGSVYNVEDVNSYLANMRQGARGAWRYTNPYTPEDHPPAAVVYLHYLLLGKLAAASGLSLELTYNLARLLCGALLLGVVYAWIAHWSPTIAVRRIAFLLIAPSGGLGWLTMLFGQGQWLGSPPLDMLSPEAYVFLTLYTPPHLALATACVLLGILWVHRACRRTVDAARLTWRVHLGPALAGGAALALVAQVGAFYLVAPAAVLGLDWVLTAIHRRRPNWRALALTALSGVLPAPLVFYTYWLFTREPVYRAWSAQNLIRSLHPLHYVAGYAVPGGLALLGLLAARRRGRPLPSLPLAWLAAAPLLLVLPLGVQRRLIIGAQVPLGVLAAQGLVCGLALPFSRSALVRRLSRHRRYSRRGLRRWLIVAVILLNLPTPALLLAGNIVRVLGRTTPIYHPRAELAAMDWLAANSAPRDTVLSAFLTGNYVPARAGNRVVLGLGPQTVNAERKHAEVRQFFCAETTDAWRKALLEQYGIVYVWFGPHERDLCRQSAAQDYNPDSVPYLHPVYNQDGYTIYEVLHENP
jgi:hypothetical protein